MIIKGTLRVILRNPYSNSKDPFEEPDARLLRPWPMQRAFGRSPLSKTKQAWFLGCTLPEGGTTQGQNLGRQSPVKNSEREVKTRFVVFARGPRENQYREVRTTPCLPVPHPCRFVPPGSPLPPRLLQQLGDGFGGFLQDLFIKQLTAYRMNHTYRGRPAPEQGLGI